jgi:hypothetical protein
MSATRAEHISQLEHVLEDYREDPETMKKSFLQLMKTTFHGVPSLSKLRDIIQQHVAEDVYRIISSLKEHMEQGNSYSASVSLVCVEFGHRSTATTTENLLLLEEKEPMDIDEQKDASKSNSDDFDSQTCREIMEQSLKEWLEKGKQFQEESGILAKYLDRNSLIASNVPSYGNCLYHAICRAMRVLFKNKPTMDHKYLRRLLVEHMEQQTIEWFDGIDKRSYLRAQEKVGEWGDSLVIKAASEKLGRPFRVNWVQAGGLETRIFGQRPPGRGRKPIVIELLLISYRHYMFACPTGHLDSLESVLSMDEIPRLPAEEPI